MLHDIRPSINYEFADKIFIQYFDEDDQIVNRSNIERCL